MDDDEAVCLLCSGPLDGNATFCDTDGLVCATCHEGCTARACLI